jgi:NADPH-dependent 2,4-dienoyl-CoA reductase/sulfur reductase-like enzyme
MTIYKYIIIGGGMTGHSAVKGIRSVDSEGSICMISQESNPPYDRPPLTKGLWKDTPFEEIWRDTTDQNIELILDRTIVSIDQVQKIIVDDQGDSYQFEKLLLATGGIPRHLKEDIEDVIYYRTLEDYKKVRELTKKAKNIGIIGGGFIGSELAASLTMNKKNVTMIFPEKGICGLVLPEPLSLYLNEYFTNKGINIYSEELVTGMAKIGNKIEVYTNKDQTLTFDCLIAGIGIIPNIQLADSIGLEIENGIIVNEFCQTSNPDIYAAGDVANFENPQLRQRIRVEHEDNANRMGENAGINMAGEPTPYNHLPFFYSDLFEMGYEATGELNAKLDIITDWKEEFKEGIIYYLRDNQVRGILCWNVFDQMDKARDIIARKEYVSENDLKGLITSDEEAEEEKEEEDKQEDGKEDENKEDDQEIVNEEADDNADEEEERVDEEEELEIEK